MEHERGERVGSATRAEDKSASQHLQQGLGRPSPPKPPLNIRQQYVQAVSELKDIADSLRAAGADIEQIARALHAERCAIRDAFRALTPPDILGEIYKRSVRTYGDQQGPTLYWLRKQGKSWSQIIDSATRVGVPPVPRTLR